MNRSKERISPIYRAIRWLVWLAYPKIEVVGAENLPDEPAVIVGNHAQINGPIACELYLPGKRYIWCVAEMMHLREVPAYAYRDFWSQKPGYSRWFYRLLSYAIAPLAACIFNNAHTIPVYHDARALSTFKETAEKLQDGANVVIFPEHDEKHNHIVSDFQNRFVDVGRLYHKRTGRELNFVPMYVAPRLRKLYLGKPIRFCAANPIEQERQRISESLMEEITGIACSLPRHVVVPYRNIPKRDYPTNIPAEAPVHEEAGR